MTLLIARNDCWFKPPPRLLGYTVYRHVSFRRVLQVPLIAIPRVSGFSQALGDIILRCWFSTKHLPLSKDLTRDEVAVHSTVDFPGSRSASAIISQSVIQHKWDTWKKGTQWFKDSHHSNVWMGLELCRCRMWELHWAKWVWFRARWLFLCS